MVKNKNNNINKAINKINLKAVIFALFFGLLGATIMYTSFAASNSTASATINISNSNPVYNDVVTITGNLNINRQETSTLYLFCYQNNKTVLGGPVQIFNGAYSQNFTLAPSGSYQATLDPAQPANCTANVNYYSWKGHTEIGGGVLNSLSFTVSPQ